jgi:hypothetical protein
MMTCPRSLLLSLVMASAGACASSPPPFRSTKLLMERTESGGLRPFVQATVAGQPIRLLLDTGATGNVLPAAFARAQRLRTGTSGHDSIVVDVHGNRTTLSSLPNVPVQFEGAAKSIPLDFMMNVSSGIDEGVLAPQELLRPGWAMTIDLEREELRFDPEEIALGAVSQRGTARVQLEFGRCLDEGLFNRLHRIVTATVNGVPAKMLVDTGATITGLSRNNPALPSLARAVGRRGAAGGMTSTGQALVLEDVPVEFAGIAFVVPAVVFPASSQCWQGALGADLLRHCTIVWGWSDLWVTCRAPSSTPSTQAPRPVRAPDIATWADSGHLDSGLTPGE